MTYDWFLILFVNHDGCHVKGRKFTLSGTPDFTTFGEFFPFITSPPEGVARYCFHPVCLSVCLSVCLCVCLCVCLANILVFYFSAIRRDIDLKFIQDTYRVVLNSLKQIDLHRSKVKATGTVHCLLKVQSYHKN